MTGSGRAPTAGERREPAPLPTPGVLGPAPLPVTWAAKMAALGREAGADLRDGSMVPVGAGEVPKVGGNRVVRALISAASKCWRALLK